MASKAERTLGHPHHQLNREFFQGCFRLLGKHPVGDLDRLYHQLLVDRPSIGSKLAQFGKGNGLSAVSKVRFSHCKTATSCQRED